MSLGGQKNMQRSRGRYLSSLYYTCNTAVMGDHTHEGNTMLVSTTMN